MSGCLPSSSVSCVNWQLFAYISVTSTLLCNNDVSEIAPNLVKVHVIYPRLFYLCVYALSHETERKKSVSLLFANNPTMQCHIL